jgi:hypothetical protein
MASVAIKSKTKRKTPHKAGLFFVPESIHLQTTSPAPILVSHGALEQLANLAEL